MILAKAIKTIIYDECLNVLFNKLSRNLNINPNKNLNLLIQKIKNRRNELINIRDRNQIRVHITEDMFDLLIEYSYSDINYLYNKYVNVLDEKSLIEKILPWIDYSILDDYL